jgi:PiT family inorganic phosphate transporter
VIATIEFIVLAPLLGFVLALALVVIVIRLFWRFAASRVDRWFRVIQLGAPRRTRWDTARTTRKRRWGSSRRSSTRRSGGTSSSSSRPGKVEFPFWIVLVCHLAIAVGR